MENIRDIYFLIKIMKKMLFGFVFSLSILAGISFAQWSWMPPNPPQGFCDGTGSVITYNTMPWSSEWHYLRTGDWISDDEATAAGCSIENDTSGNCEGEQTENNNCMLNNLNVTPEEDFIAGRKCSGSSCSDNDPIHAYDEGGTYPTYDFSISESISAGDRIRVLVYVHNTAEEGLYPTTDTKVNLNWNETTETISSHISYKVPGSSVYQNSTTSTLNLPNLGTNLKLTPLRLSRLNYIAGDPGYHEYNPSLSTTNFIIDEENKTATYTMGQHYSSYANRKYVYIDFDVTEEVVPSFTIQKSSTPPAGTPLDPGDQITYTVTVENTGNTDLFFVKVHDELDSSLSFISGDTGVSSFGGPVVFLDFETLSVGEVSSLNFIVQVDDPIASGVVEVCNNPSQISSDASYPSGAPWISGDYLTDNICHPINVITNPSFNVVKSVVTPPTTDTVEAGDQITYRVTVNNNGDVPLTNITVLDTLESNLVWFSGDAGVSHSGATPDIVSIFIPGPLAAGTSISRDFTVSIINPLPQGITEVCNDLTSAHSDDPNNQNVIGSVTGNICHHINVITNPSFTVEKLSDPNPGTEIFPGGTITYEIVVHNDGDGDLTNVNIEDPLNSNLIFISGDGGVTHTGSSPGGTVNIHFDSLPNGDEYTKFFTVQVVNPLIVDSPQVCNAIGQGPTAEDANGNTVIGYDITNGNGSPICHPVDDDEPSFTVEKSSTPPAGQMLSPGEEFTYTLTVTNTGDVDLTNVIVFDSLSNQLNFVSGPTGVSHDGSTAGGVVTVNFPGTLTSPNGTLTATFTVKVINNPVSNQVCNSLDTDDTSATDPEGNDINGAVSGEPCHPINDIEPEYVIHKTDTLLEGAVYNIGDEFEYIITVENTGGIDIPYVVATDELSDDLEYVGPFDDLTINYDPTTHTVTMSFYDVSVATGQQKTFQVRVLESATACEDLCNTVNSEITDAPIRIGVDEPVLGGPAISKTKPDNIIDTISNWTSKTWESVKKIAKKLFTAAIGQDIIQNKIAKPTPKIALDNLIAIDPGDDTNTFCRPIYCPQGLNIEKASSPVPGTNVQANGIITYSITVSNPSEETMTNVLVIDDLEENLTFVETDAPDVVVENPANSGHIELNFGDIAPLDNETLSFDVQVSENVVNGDQVCNIATYEDADGNSYSTEEICHPIGSGGGGGGGGGGDNVIIGSCSTWPNGTGYCQDYMVDTSGDDWDDCMLANNNDEDFCAEEWADANGLYNGCDSNDDCQIIVNLPDPENCYVGGCPALEGRIEKTAVDSHVAVNENADYNVKIWLTNKSSETIKLSELKVYDLSVPADSGWIWNHVLTDEANENWEFVPQENGINYFEFRRPELITISPLTSREGGVEVSRNLTYAMDTALTINSDTSQVKNVVFATMKFITDAGTENEISWNLRLSDNPYLCDANGRPLAEFFAGANSTLGSTSTVTIDRPFVEVRTGSDLGVKNYSSSKNPFGGYNQGKNGGDRIELEENLFESFLDEENPANLGSEMDPVFGKFKTTADNSNVWFYNGTDPIKIDHNLNITTPMTFVIQNADLEIDGNFNLNPKFAAFVVQGDNDIIIAPNVTDIQGIFIAESGEIKSSKTESQLRISGSLMGDATNLLQNRIYIGKEVDGGWDLQPSVKINYDIRLLENTPPGLEAFLGEGSAWGQE